ADIYDSRTAEGRKRECTDSPSRSASGAPATAGRPHPANPCARKTALSSQPMKPKIFGPSPRRWSWYRGDGAWPGSALRALPALLIGLVLELGHRFLPGLVGGMDGALVCLVQKLPRQAGFRLARGQRLHQLIPGHSLLAGSHDEERQLRHRVAAPIVGGIGKTGAEQGTAQSEHSVHF